MSLRPLLAVIPARGGSKGLPGKNVRPLAGLPLIAHSIRLASLCTDIDRCIVSTDSEQIADVAREYGGDVPFLRPVELAQDTTPMWPVLRHALAEVEHSSKQEFGSVLLLDPTSPGRMPEDVAEALRILEGDPEAVGVVAVSEPPFNPRWVCVEEVEGHMRPLVHQAESYVRRQDVSPVYRINAILYLWRRDHMIAEDAPRFYESRHRILVVPDERAIHIDEPRDFALAELFVREGLVKFPWLTTPASVRK